ncbi:MAG: oligosaccharide flippase family protein [Opitutales bacterium]|nr:oligosaccharide flippase family protein [Opitutales bacterium]
MAFAAQGVTLLLSFCSRIIFVRVLSAEYLGISGLFTNILQVLSFAELGLGTAMMYSFYKPVAENDSEKIAALVAFFKSVYRWIALTVGGLGLAIFPFLDCLVNFDKPIEHLNVYYLLFLLSTVLSYFFVFRTSLFVAYQKEYVLKTYHIFLGIISFVLQIFVLIFTKNYMLYLCTSILMMFISNLICNQVAYKYFPYLKKSASVLEKSEKKKIFDNVKSLFIYKVSAIIQTNTDVILISIFVGTLTVGYYSNYLLITSVVGGVISMIFGSAKASLGNLIASETTTQNSYFVFKTMEKLSFWLTGFSCVCFGCLTQDFIAIVFGEEYVLDEILLALVIANFYINNIRHPIWAYRETAGIFHQTRHITVVTSTLNLLLSLILGKYYGLHGIIFATAISKMLYGWWKEPLILYSVVFKTSPVHYFFVYFIDFCVLIAVFSVTFFITKNISLENSYLAFVLKMVVCAIVPNVFIAFYILPTQEGKYFLNKFKKTFSSTKIIKS